MLEHLSYLAYQHKKDVKMRFIIGLNLIFLLSACTTTSNHYISTMNSWHSANLRSLVKIWGLPDKKISSPDGHILYVYYTQSYHSYAGPSSPSIGVNVNSAGSPIIATTPNTNMTWNRGNMSLVCMAIFDVAPNGTIVNTQIQGDYCYMNERLAKKMSNSLK